MQQRANYIITSMDESLGDIDAGQRVDGFTENEAFRQYEASLGPVPPSNPVNVFEHERGVLRRLLQKHPLEDLQVVVDTSGAGPSTAGPAGGTLGGAGIACGASGA